MELEPLVRLVRSLSSDKEVTAFWLSFFTPSEREDILNRYNLVKMLLEGKTQREIAQTLGIGIATVSRGAAELKRGEGKTFFPFIYDKLKQ